MTWTKKERKSPNIELQSGSGQFGRTKRRISIHITRIGMARKSKYACQGFF